MNCLPLLILGLIVWSTTYLLFGWVGIAVLLGISVISAVIVAVIEARERERVLCDGGEGQNMI